MFSSKETRDRTETRKKKSNRPVRATAGPALAQRGRAADCSACAGRTQSCTEPSQRLTKSANGSLAEDSSFPIDDGHQVGLDGKDLLMEGMEPRAPPEAKGPDTVI